MSKKLLVCDECGGSNVQVRAWVDANTNEFKGESGDYDKDSQWCDDCQEHNGFETINIQDDGNCEYCGQNCWEGDGQMCDEQLAN